VVSGGRLVGVLPRQEPLETSAPTGLAGEAVTRDGALFVDARESLETVVRRLQRGAVALVVVENGRATGLVTGQAVERAMR
jgi:hypothetical protein